MSTTMQAAESRNTHQLKTDLVTRKQGAAFLGVSETTFWRLAEFDPSFPAKIRLSPRRVAWRLSALNEWLESREGE